MRARRSPPEMDLLGSRNVCAMFIVSNFPLTSLLATSFVAPVYIPLSSLLRPRNGQDPSANVVELDPTVFAHPVRRDILHLCVVHFLDSLRQGSANTKTRAEVRGSGRKIRPQKGSGMARLGDGQSPMLRGGGVAFGPKPRDFSTKLPRKVIQMGMRAALSARAKEGALKVVESLEWEGLKTKDMVRRLGELGWEQKTLFVTGKDVVPSNLERSTSNIYRVDTITVDELNVYDLVKWPHVVLDLDAVGWLEKKLSKADTPLPTS
ncbi:ribosomal protein L4 [Amylostereum chailletii]|nr:ribosomal protein L4 [Amylostereum chailletii]